MLIRDVENMSLLNLSSKELNERPNDFYNYTVISLNKLMKEELNKLIEEGINPTTQPYIEAYNRLLNLNRDHIKNALMTFNYNASKITMTEYIEEKVAEISKKTVFQVIDGDLKEIGPDVKFKKGERFIKIYTNEDKIFHSSDILLYVNLFNKFIETKIPRIH